MPYFNSEKLLIYSFVLFAHISLVFFVKTDRDNRDLPLNSGMVRLVVLPEFSPIRSEPKVSVSKDTKKLQKKIKKIINRPKEITKPKKVKKPIETINPPDKDVEDDLTNNENNQADNLSFSNTSAVPAASDSSANFELSVPMVVQNVAYVDKNICTPKYPRISRKRGERGRVLIKVVINREGFSEKVEIQSSSGFNRLDRAAVRAAKRCRFVAAKKNGKPVKGLATIPYNFIF